jgi:hypothetical protein
VVGHDPRARPDVRRGANLPAAPRLSADPEIRAHELYDRSIKRITTNLAWEELDLTAQTYWRWKAQMPPHGSSHGHD